MLLPEILFLLGLAQANFQGAKRMVYFDWQNALFSNIKKSLVCTRPYDEIIKLRELKSFEPQEWSWLVKIGECHGALVSNQFVVTAPACCSGASGKSVILADRNTNKVDKVIINMESDDIRDEICLIKLKTPVAYSNRVYPICTDDTNGDVSRAMRAFSKNNLFGNTDMAVDLLPPVMCPRLEDNKGSTCVVGAGENSFTDGFCPKNLGAPIVSVQKKSVILVGIITHPFGDCKHIQGFATQIAKVEKWIKQNIKFHENFWSFTSAERFQEETTGFELSGKSMLAEMGQNQCKSEIDGFGRSGASLVRSLQNKIVLDQITSGEILAEESEFAGKFPPRDMRTTEFWEDFEQRVVGSNIEPQENPWTWMVDFDGTCAGALISAEVAITSAMCCGFIDHDTAYIGGFAERESGVKRTIRQKTVSPDFNQGKLRNDLCLVSFTEPLELGPNLRPICLPSGGFSLEDGEHLFIAGWGSRTVTGALSDNLSSAALPVVSFKTCEKEYGDLGLELDNKAHFCANSPNGGIGPCRGDWGAPSVVMRAGQPVLAGVVSFGRGCGHVAFSSVYTNLASYHDWIVATGKDMSVVQTTTTSTTSTTITTTTTAPEAVSLDENFTGVTGGSCESVFDTMFSSTGRSSIASDVPFEIGQKISYSDYFLNQERRSAGIFGGRLVGGEKVEESGEWPFAVNIAGKCGGSLIGRRWVVTAAHCCIDEILTNTSSITIGANFLRDATEDQLFAAEDYVSHPSFNEYNYNNDICVIKLDRDVEYSGAVSPVCLNENVAHNSGFQNFIAGWGQTKAGGVMKNFISEASVESLRRSECKELVPDEFLKKKMFCSRGKGGSLVRTCDGDAGGPHVSWSNGSPVLTGVLSWASDCGSDDAFSIVTNVQDHLDFIAHAVAQLEIFELEPFVDEVLVDESSLVSNVDVYKCPNPLDLFQTIRPADTPASATWPWKAVVNDYCAGVLIGASQVLTTADCCGNQMKGKPVKVNGQTRAAFIANKKDNLCLIQTSSPFVINTDVTPICIENSIQKEVQLSSDQYVIVGQFHEEKLSLGDISGGEFTLSSPENDTVCDLQPGSASVAIGGDGYPILTGIYQGKAECFSSATFTNIFEMKSWLIDTAKELGAYKESKFIDTNDIELMNNMEAYKSAGAHCVSPFDNLGNQGQLTRSAIRKDVKKRKKNKKEARLSVGFNVRDFEDWSFIGSINGTCGITLIAKRWALTSADCCLDIAGKWIHFGSLDIGNFETGTVVEPQNIFIHPDFNERLLQNNICVVELNNAVEYSATLGPACLDTSAIKQSTPSDPSIGFIAGFGGEKLPLKQAPVAVIPDNDCKISYGESSITRDQFCAGYSTGEVDACKSDVGGPFMTINAEAGQRKLSGIISWSRGCGKEGRPAVYSKISSYANWIFETIRDVDAPISIGTTNEFEIEVEKDDSNPDFNLASERVFSKLNIPAQCVPNFKNQGAKTFVKSDTKNWPFAVNINRQCTGTLIDTNMVLTSAFCCQSVSPSDIQNTRVNMGSKKAIGKQSVRMHSFAIHPRFSNVNGIRKNDICLIRLIRHVEISEEIRPLCLATELPKANTPVYTAGWPGAHGGFKKVAKTIVERVNKKLSVSDCRKVYHGKIEDDQICVEQLPDNKMLKKTPCAKDVGAPLIVIENGEPKLLGVMGKHRNCVTERNYFTSVLDHIEWINAKVTNTHISIPPVKHNRLVDKVEDYSCPSITDHLNQFGHIFGSRSVRDTSEAAEEGSGEDRTDQFDMDVASDRIDNGHSVNRSNWPFLGNLHNFCSVALIGREYALTTATCCTAAVNRNIFFGGNSRRDDSSNFQAFVEDVRRHPDFDLDTLTNDICVIKMDRSVEYSANIKPVCINPTDIEELSTAFIAGWDSSKMLREGDVIITEFSTCNTAYALSLNKELNFCARGKEEENAIDECATDVGAPLIHVVNGRPLLSGIMSFGDSCGDESLPGIYTKVSSFVDWIVEAAEDMAVKPTTTTTTTTTPELSPAQQAGYSSSWPGFSLEDFSFNCRPNLAEMNDTHVDNNDVSVNAHTATIENSCAATLVTETHLLTSLICCSDIIGKFILFQDGQQKRVINTRVHENGLCMIELPEPVSLSTQVYPICIDEGKNLFEGIPAFIHKETISRSISSEFIAMPVGPGCHTAGGCFGFIESFDACENKDPNRPGSAIVALHNIKTPKLLGVYEDGCPENGAFTSFIHTGPLIDWMKEAMKSMRDSTTTTSTTSTTTTTTTTTTAAIALLEDANILGCSLQSPFVVESDESRFSLENIWNANKILGGQQVDERAHWPWLAHFKGAAEECAAVIVGDKFLVTSAQCCGLNILSRNVRVGTLSKFGDDDVSDEESLFKIMNFKKHDSFSDRLFNDLCVLEVDREFTFSSRVHPICLADSPPLAAEKGFVAGWGVAKANNDSFVEYFREAELEISVGSECTSTFENNVDLNIQLCVEDPSGRKAACGGDSGAPFVVLDNGVPKLAGLMSWGLGCLQADKPSVYTNIAAYRSWLENAIQLMRLTISESAQEEVLEAEPIAMFNISDAGNYLGGVSNTCESPFESNAGKQSRLLGEAKIVGGEEVISKSSWPWIGLIGQSCSVSLIAADIGITAAHCCSNPTLMSQSVTFGDLSRNGMTQAKMIKRHVIHPDFFEADFEFDVCILFFHESVEYDENTSSVCLTDQDEPLPPVGAPVFIAGWGLVEDGGTISLNLREVAVTIVDYAICNAEDAYDGVYTKLATVRNWIDSTIADYRIEFAPSTTSAPIATTSTTTAAPIFDGVTFQKCASFLDVNEEGADRFESFDLADNAKIIGGSEVVDRTQWPWMVSIGDFCGGSIVGNRWVLTAAHCCSKDKFSIQNVYIGHVDRLNLDSKEAIPISSFRVHPDFNEETLENDLCLIKLARELEYSDTVQPLCINDEEFDLESGSEAFIAGWGLVKEDGSASQFLKEARIPIVSNEECSVPYGDDFKAETMFCAGYAQGGIDSCQGDSGGPLVLLENDVPTAHGVVSWGVGCGRAGMYGVYAKLVDSKVWMQNAAGEMGHAVFRPTTTPAQVATTPHPLLTLLTPFDSGCGAFDLPQFGTHDTGATDGGNVKPWPFMVRFSGKCAGSLVSNAHVITSAHCCRFESEGFQFTDFEVELGFIPKQGRFSESRRIHSILLHPGNVEAKLSGDLCLVQLDEPVQFNTFIKPICPTDSLTASPITHFFAGKWTPNSNTIEEFVMSSMNETSCASAVSRSLFADTVCVEGDAQVDPCDTNSGAPLVGVINNRLRLLGVATASYGCNSENLPNLYSSISSYSLFFTNGFQQLADATSTTTTTTTTTSTTTTTTTTTTTIIPHLADLPPRCDSKYDLLNANVLSDEDGKIINGQNANTEEWPWYVQLRGCGGSIIGRRFVLTAAHCCQGNQLGFEANIRGQKVKMIRKRNHGGFTMQLDFDFCLLLTNKPIMYNDRVQPICMIEQGGAPPEHGEDLFVAGTGVGSGKRLKEVLVPYINYSTCRLGYGDRIRSASMFCAGYMEAGF
ncbi:Oidioi.mRNA.OKI2018_I69.chr1.g3483.t1.cds [Oikopleura dioica]|uniref:Oidioi.mRNA.OKI2018_I69.chr1.g3483.t1.cds n=1 Tax=Oikopleura dioica TaxID=34765 RepID=A0ABN7SU83_OIKDI|nr:Oidioi.mRNA.OKI2018_I69.chr1.g3483.t1.cds [Oikopleura dioica]